MEPRETLLAVNDAFTRRDPAGMLEHYAPDAEVIDHRQGGLGHWKGHDELLAYYAGICEQTVELREDIEVFDEQGDVVVAGCHFTARLAADGPAPEFAIDYGLVATIRDGLVQRLDIHQDPASARASANG